MNKSMFVVGSVGPGVESDLINGQADLVFGYLCRLLEFAPKFKHVFVGYIPSELLPYFSGNARLRIFVEQIESDSQSNILFAPSTGACGYARFTLDGEDVSELGASRMLSSLFRAGYLPVALQREGQLVKLLCGQCEHGMSCIENEDIPVLDAQGVTNALSVIDEAADREICLHEVGVIGACIDRLVRVARLMSILYRVDGVWDRFSGSLVLQHFIDDIRRSRVPLRDVAFSMYRALAFDGARRSSREGFSIDVHQHNPPKYDDVNLFRCDVLPPHKSGISHTSGRSRILIGKYRGVSVFVAYTDDHDFSKEALKVRTDVLKANVDEYLDCNN